MTAKVNERPICIDGLNQRDGKLRFVTRLPGPSTHTLEHLWTLAEPLDIAPGGRKSTLPAGTVCRLVGIVPRMVPDIEDDDALDVIVETKLLWEPLP